jgi:hypothetical protein
MFRQNIRPNDATFTVLTSYRDLLELGSEVEACSRGHTGTSTMKSFEQILNGGLTKGFKAEYQSLLGLAQHKLQITHPVIEEHLILLIDMIVDELHNEIKPFIQEFKQ